MGPLLNGAGDLARGNADRQICSVLSLRPAAKRSPKPIYAEIVFKERSYNLVVDHRRRSSQRSLKKS